MFLEVSWLAKVMHVFIFTKYSEVILQNLCQVITLLE